MIIFGMDPGTKVTGYGIVKYDKNALSCIAKGIIVPSVALSLPYKLQKIYDEIESLLKIYKPDEFAVEAQFMGKNIQSALKVGYVKGIAMLAAVRNGVCVAEYSPREVKKSVTGKGAASKEQVQYMIRHLLRLDDEKIALDASDAMAIAVCHAFKIKSATPRSASWKDFAAANPDRIIG